MEYFSQQNSSRQDIPVVVLVDRGPRLLPKSLQRHSGIGQRCNYW